jgi:hypothetical protein
VMVGSPLRLAHRCDVRRAKQRSVVPMTTTNNGDACPRRRRPVYTVEERNQQLAWYAVAVVRGGDRGYLRIGTPV